MTSTDSASAGAPGAGTVPGTVFRSIGRLHLRGAVTEDDPGHPPDTPCAVTATGRARS
jgi:hypothetical protein